MNTIVGEAQQPIVLEETATRALHVVDLRKSFASPRGERIEVLRGVTVEVNRGEVVAITGASGSGKSTLLHLLGRLDEPDHGSIAFGNYDLLRLGGDRIAEFRQTHVGFVFQFHYLLNDLSALENVALPLLISRNPRSTAVSRARHLLTELGLDDRADYPASHLSGGEQQRIAVARAMINSPQLLLADEPTGNLDAEIGIQIGKTIANYVRTKDAVAVVATHNEAVASLCDRTLVLEDGRIRPI